MNGKLLITYLLIFNNICGLELEMSLKNLYNGEKLFSDFYQLFYQNGFVLNSVEPVYFNEKELFQLNGIFIKKNLFFV